MADGNGGGSNDRGGEAGRGEVPPGRPPARGGDDRWNDIDEVRRVRLRDQVQLILDSVPGAAFYPPGDAADAEYLYVEGRLLVRDADLTRVQDVIAQTFANQPVVVEAGSVNGLTVLTFHTESNSALDLLTAVETQLGEGVATPEHIFYVCPVGRLCPADEPTPVDTTTAFPASWRLRPGADGIAVTVIDTGLVDALTTTHPWLAGVTGEPDTAVTSAGIGPYGGHGSFVAGVLRTVAPRAEVHVENILNVAGAVTETELVLGLYRAMDRMPDVISMSAGTHTHRNVPPIGLEVFWQERLRHVKGTALVVAAGNDGARNAFWPAAFDWTVSVGAIAADGTRAPFSNFGSWVDVYALGVDLVNAYPAGTFTYQEPPRQGTTAEFSSAMARWSGTSFSTPLVAGMIAARAAHTGQSGAQAARSVLRIARSHATPGVGAIADPVMAHAPDPAGP